MKWVDYKKFFAGLVMLTAAQFAHAESYNIEMHDVDVAKLIGTVSEVTGKNFALDESLVGKKVTVIGNTEVEANDLYEVLLSVLSVNGMTVVDTGKITKVIASNKSKYQSSAFLTQQELDNKPDTLKSDSLITSTVFAKHVPVAHLVPILRPMVSPTGHLQAFSPSNSLLITDTLANVERVAKIVKSMDSPEDDMMEIVYLRYAQATDVADVIAGLNDESDQTVPKKYKVSVDTRTNSLLIEGTEFVRSHVKGIIRGLDRQKKAPETPSGDAENASNET